jgi:hypothetical protein
MEKLLEDKDKRCRAIGWESPVENGHLIGPDGEN